MAAIANAEPDSQGNEHQQQPDSSSDWGLNNADNWGDEMPSDTQHAANQSLFDFSDLEQALSTAHTSKTPVSQPQHMQAALQTQHQHQSVSSCTLDGKLVGPQLPGFYLHMTPESAGASASMTAEEQHIADLVAAYQADNQQVRQLSYVHTPPPHAIHSFSF